MTVEHTEIEALPFPVDFPEDICHISCHCDGFKMGLCGIDLSDVPVEDWQPEDIECPMCAMLCANRAGCACPADCVECYGDWDDDDA